MKIRRTLPVTISLLVVLSSFLSCKPNGKNSSKNLSKNPPNVILILADDMGWSDLGCYGSEVNTPNLDLMASQGIRFTQMYNTSKCHTSRASLLTGLYAQQTGYHKTYKQPMKNAITLGELFKEAGYTTLWAGKHHSTELPTTRGFDHYSGLFEGASNHFNPGKQREGEGQPAQKRPDRPWVLDGEIYQPYTPPKDFYTTDAFTDYALGWMDQLRSDSSNNKPFFLYMSYTAPHDPLMAWPEDIDKYKGKYLSGYKSIRDARFEKQKEIGLLPENYPISQASFLNWEGLSDKKRKEEELKMAVYGAMIDRLDQNIGRLISKLDEMGEKENTLILFMSDNGASAEKVNINEDGGQVGTMERWSSLEGNWANVSNVPLRLFKNYSHEGGIKTPFIAYWPKGIKDKNSINRTPLHFIDLMPTFADLTQTKYPLNYNNQNIIPHDGTSFLPIFNGGEIKRDKPLYWQWRDGKAIRDGDWKLVAYRDKWALYNLSEDPIEENDLSLNYPDKLERLKNMYEAWAIKFD